VETRLIIAYALIALMVVGVIAAWIMIVAKRRDTRDLRRGRRRYPGLSHKREHGAHDPIP